MIHVIRISYPYAMIPYEVTTPPKWGVDKSCIKIKRGQ
jgi:hypothetical protein